MFTDVSTNIISHTSSNTHTHFWVTLSQQILLTFSVGNDLNAEDRLGACGADATFTHAFVHHGPPQAGTVSSQHKFRGRKKGGKELRMDFLSTQIPLPIPSLLLPLVQELNLFKLLSLTSVINNEPLFIVNGSMNHTLNH